MDNEMMISGKWFNKNTGAVVNVVNNVIDGDDMIIITDKGPINLNDFGEYIQMSDEIYNEQGQVIGNEQIDYSSVVPPKVSIKETKKTIQQNRAPAPLPEEQNLEFDDSAFVSVPEPVVQKPVQAISNNEHIISKFFDKINGKEKLILISLDTSILPINDLRTITNYMDVSVDEIATYISEKLIDKTYISNIIQKALTELLERRIKN